MFLGIHFGSATWNPDNQKYQKHSWWLFPHHFWMSGFFTTTGKPLTGWLERNLSAAKTLGAIVDPALSRCIAPPANVSLQGGVHKWGTPIAGENVMENPIRMDDDWGYPYGPMTQETTIEWTCQVSRQRNSPHWWSPSSPQWCQQGMRHRCQCSWHLQWLVFFFWEETRGKIDEQVGKRP